LHLNPGDWQVIHMPGASAIGKNSESSSDDLTALFGEMKIAMATVVEGEIAEVMLGAPPADPVDLKGRVVADGKGVAGVVVTFVADGGQGMDSLKFTTTDSAGRFATVLNEPGGYVVTVQRTGAVGQQQNIEFHERIPEQPEFELVLELPKASISGKVRGADGRPAEGVRMSLNVEGPVRNGSFTGGHWAEITTDAEGRYEFEWLRPGTYTVAAGGSFFGGLFGRTDQGRQLRGGVKVEEGQRLDDVDFKLNVPGTLEGTVVDGGGRPVSEASIFVFASRPPPPTAPAASSTSPSSRAPTPSRCAARPWSPPSARPSASAPARPAGSRSASRRAPSCWSTCRTARATRCSARSPSRTPRATRSTGSGR
jgi:protocatechuate 3,4-dioxygenase beta subunit